MQIPPPLTPRRPPDWWARNWKWFVPSICVVGLLLAGVFVIGVMAVMKKSGAYAGALARAKASPALIEAIGSPIEDGFFVLGKIQGAGDGGVAELTIPITGPKGKATIYTAAVKSSDVWHFNHLVVKIDRTGKRIDLSTVQPEQSR